MSDTYEFPAALLRRASATRSQVLSLEARWTGASTAARKKLLQHIDSLDEAGLRAELTDLVEGWDGGLSDDEAAGLTIVNDPPAGDPDTAVVDGGLAFADDPERHDPELAAQSGIEQGPGAYEETTYEDSASVLNGGTNTDSVSRVGDGQPGVEGEQVPPLVGDDDRVAEVLSGTVDDVKAHLSEHPEDRAAVDRLERAGQGRKTILDVTKAE